MVSDPARIPPSFAATVNATAPGPMPIALPAMVIQGTLLTAVHAHPFVVVTWIGVPAPPPAAADCVAGVRLNAQLTPPSCDTVTVLPATVTDPERAAPEFAATLTLTVPVPVRVLPAVTVIHEALLATVHAQLLVVDTVNGPPAPPAAPTVRLVGVTVNTHGVAAS